MHNIALLAAITFKDSIRSKGLYGIFALGLILFVANFVITGMFSWEVGKVAVDVGLSAVSVSGLIIIFFFSISMVANDLDRKIIYLILSKPIAKYQYILGKYIGLALIILLSSTILGISSFLSVKLSLLGLGAEAFIPVNFSWGVFVLGLVYLTLALLLVLAIAFLCISVTTHPFTALLLCMVTYFVGQNVENVVNILSRNPAFANNTGLQAVTQTVSWFFPNLAAFDLKTTAAYGLPLDGGYLVWTALYAVTYIGICLAASMLIFQRRELA